MKLKLIHPKTYYIEFKQLFRFVVNPIYNSTQVLTKPQKIAGTWTMFVVKFVLTVIVGASIGVFYDAENLTTSNMKARFSPLVLLVLSLLILPLLEEGAYRLSLKFKPIFPAITLSIFTYYIFSKGVYHTKLSDVYSHFMERCLIALSVVLVFYPLFSIPKIKHVLELFWTNHFRWIYYGSCLLFAWSHITNYELTIEHLLLMPLITMDKLVSGLCYGYTRVHYGFYYSFAIHMLNNSIGFIVALFLV
ncbi:CPBP family glutamic-type intramembrane protease [Lacinutrix neustonica]|uniref:CPBP family glutamic-type intramembrane protease n=1 Tax=Lacinutrix neustonica TaxID=2980107 RepID=A0A9E8SE65_9FLAO|nr:CPBP family glutamic-type intramembrane protease [Lacinutrix neustonica]WAC02447.1 CPBP family glutamic-type intramembrane protease [Lacinutrix neustonica]